MGIVFLRALDDDSDIDCRVEDKSTLMHFERGDLLNVRGRCAGRPQTRIRL